MIKIAAGRIKKARETVMTSEDKRDGRNDFLLLCSSYLSHCSYSVFPTTYPQLIPNNPPGSLHIHHREPQ